MAVRRIPSLLVSTVAFVAFGAAGCSSAANGSPATTHVTSPPVSVEEPTLPKPDHIVVVLFENKEEKQVAGSSSAPYFNELAARGASFTDSTGVTRPPVSHHRPLRRRFASQY